MIQNQSPIFNTKRHFLHPSSQKIKAELLKPFSKISKKPKIYSQSKINQEPRPKPIQIPLQIQCQYQPQNQESNIRTNTKLKTKSRNQDQDQMRRDQVKIQKPKRK